MQIIVIGAGAIGLLVTARLAASGENRVALLARSNAAALESGGIKLTYQGETRQIRNFEVFRDPAAAPFRPELIIVCVKGYDTASVLPSLQALDGGFILTLQNGIGNEEALAEAFTPAQILSGAITTSVEVDGPNQITITKNGGIGIAPVANQPTASFAAPFARAGFETHEIASYLSMKWSKALLNMLGNATAAILDMPVAEVYADERLIDLERRAFREALAVMDRRGIKPINLPRYPAAPLSVAMRYFPTPVLYPILRRTVAGGRGDKLPSLLIELRKGNPRSEGKYLNGAIAAEAARVGVPAPVNAALWRTLEGIATEQIDWEQFRRNPAALLAVAK